MNWRRRDRWGSPQRPAEDPSVPTSGSRASAAARPQEEAAEPTPTEPSPGEGSTGNAPPPAPPAADDGATAAPGSGEAAGTASGPRPLPAPDLGPVALSGPEPAPANEAVVLAVTNQKGGVGKTTTTVSLGAALAGEGLDVLLVDLDPQGNATTGLGLRVSQGSPSSYRVIVERQPLVDASEPTSVRHLHIVPSSLDLAGAEIELVPQFSRERRLQEALDPVRDQYDVVLIDCPPSLGLLTVNALVAADLVLVPIQCEYYALEGLGQLMRTIEMVRSGLNNGLALGGVLMTMFDGRTNLSQQVVDEVRGHFGELAFSTVIPRTVRLSEAPSYGQPITEFDPSSRGARAYQRLARELAARLELVPEDDRGLSPLDALLGTAAGPDGSGIADPTSTSDDRRETPVNDPPGTHGAGAAGGRGPLSGDSDASSQEERRSSTNTFHVDRSTTDGEGSRWQT